VVAVVEVEEEVPRQLQLLLDRTSEVAAVAAVEEAEEAEEEQPYH
jgi:hypothetical protein